MKRKQTSSITQIYWSTAESAKKWPEGSIVLIQRLDRDIMDYNALEIVKHFRPDWVGNPDGYGSNLKRFCRLTSFVKHPV